MEPTDGPDRSQFDRTMEALVPGPTRVRNAALLLTALLVIAAVWWSPRVLRPSLSPQGSGTWTALPTHRQALVATTLEADGWRGVDVQRALSVPGARVAGAWVIGAEFDHPYLGEESEYPSGFAYAQARFPSIGAESALPQRIPDGATVALVILWDIDECEFLSQRDTADVEIRTLLRRRLNENVGPIASPTWSFELLVATGICPRPAEE